MLYYVRNLMFSLVELYLLNCDNEVVLFITKFYFPQNKIVILSLKITRIFLIEILPFPGFLAFCKLYKRNHAIISFKLNYMEIHFLIEIQIFSIRQNSLCKFLKHTFINNLNNSSLSLAICYHFCFILIPNISSL